MATLLGNTKEYKGDVVFYKDTEYNFISCCPCEEDGTYFAGSGKVELGRARVEVTFSDSTEAEIESLEEAKRNVLIESQRAVKRIDEKIQNLRAITHQE